MKGKRGGLFSGVILLGSFLLFPAYCQEAATFAPLLAGAARFDITPSDNLYLAGFGPNRRSRGVHDPLYARALVFKKGDQTIGLVVLDSLGLWAADVARIRRIVRPLFADRLIVASTHNHSAPDMIGAWGPSLLGLGLLPYRSGVDGHYRKRLQEGAVAALLMAYKNLKEARVRFASAQVEGVAKNIRDPSRLDKELLVLRVEEAARGNGIATLVNYACHAEVLWSDNRLISADFPGYLCRRLEERLPGIGLFLNGALGGMVTANVALDARGKELHTFAEAERIGHLLADMAWEALRTADSSPNPELTWHRAEVYIPFDNWRYRWGRRFGILERELFDGRLRTEVIAARIGEGEIATLPGEALPNLGLELKSRMQGPYKLVLGLVGDELGYILDEQDFSQDLYSYERSMSVSRQAWPLLFSTLQELLQRLP